MYSIGKFAEKLGITPQTLRNWEKNGNLIPQVKTKAGTRYYTEHQFLEYTGTQEELIQDLISIIHVFSCRIYGLRKYKNNIKKDPEL